MILTMQTCGVGLEVSGSMVRCLQAPAGEIRDARLPHAVTRAIQLELCVLFVLHTRR